MPTQRRKFIEDLYDQHKEEEIWIIGTGKSLDDFPTNFFDDKISIALNGAIFKYPNPTYYHCVHTVWFEKILATNPNVLDKTFTSYQINNKGAEIKVEADRILEKTRNKNRVYWLFLDITLIKNQTPIRKTISDIKEKSRKVRFCEQETILHLAMEVAYLFGANKITLAGCENKVFGNSQQYASSLNIAYPIPQISWGDTKRCAPTVTKLIADVLIENSVSTERYYYKTTDFYTEGYEKI